MSGMNIKRERIVYFDEESGLAATFMNARKEETIENVRRSNQFLVMWEGEDGEIECSILAHNRTMIKFIMCLKDVVCFMMKRIGGK